MIEELGQSPELQMPKAKGVRKRVIEDGWKTDCGDVYSPPRITKVAARMGLKPAWALDLTTRDVDDGKPWDFSNKEKRKKAAMLLEQDKPLLLVVSPMCGPFNASMEHVKFALDLCLQQYKQGRFFIFEHSASAASWSTKMMQQMLNLEGITTAKFDFCQLGMETMGRSGEAMAAKKRTTVMTNSPNVSEVLRQAQCEGKHTHEQLVGGKANNCEVYPDKFVELVCEGIRKEILDAKWRGQIVRQFDISTPSKS